MFAKAGAVRRQPIAAQAAADDELRLLDRIAARDMRAFEQLYFAYHQRLTRFLSNMLRRPDLVEEVLNDALLVVWTRPDKYNGASKLSTWIFAIAYRKALKALHRKDEPVEDPREDARPSGEPGPEQLLQQRQAQVLLREAMQHLSAEQRAVVDLTYFHEMGYREIAEVMACPVDTVKTRMFHARRRLKALLAGRLSDWL
jgi:RNA polymerase sigma-70 factor (ECF subfamily)